MSLSLRHAPITDARTQAAISKARSQNGVHYYFTEPRTKVNNEFRTLLADMAGTKSTYLTWTSLFRATADQPAFGLQLGIEGKTSTLEYGVTDITFEYYAARRENKIWNQENYSAASWKKGQYGVFTLYIQYPQGTNVEPIKVDVNGAEQPRTLKFTDVKTNFTKLGSTIKQHGLKFFKIELLETHFLYTGITEGLPPRASPTGYISLKNAELAYITQWDTVIIQGQYAALNKTYKGILVGVSAANKSAAFYDFASYQGDTTAVTIRLTVGFNDVAVSTNKEQRVLNIAIGPDDNAWLLVDNINISNLEIHTTAKIEK